MINKSLRDISKEDLDALITNQVSESRTLDYKQALTPGKSSDFLEDVCALANTAGGDLILGMTASDGIPTGYALMKGPADAQILAMENSIRDGLEPRLVGTDVWPIEIEKGGLVYVIRVPRSWNAPHRVITTKRFMGRNSRGNYALDISELRGAFASAEAIPERIRAFRASRIIRVHSGDTPFTMPAGAKLVVHLVPLQAFSTASVIDLRGIESAGALPLIALTGAVSRRNLDGILSFKSREDAAAYTQLFHNGVIEAVVSIPWHPKPGDFYQDWFEVEATKSIDRYLDLLEKKHIAPPVYLFLTLLGFKQAVIIYGNSPWIERTDPLDRDIADFPEIVLNALTMDLEARQLFIDRVWQAFGHDESPNRIQG